jgi:hypothetical protein
VETTRSHQLKTSTSPRPARNIDAPLPAAARSVTPAAAGWLRMKKASATIQA